MADTSSDHAINGSEEVDQEEQSAEKIAEPEKRNKSKKKKKKGKNKNKSKNKSARYSTDIR